MTEPTKRRRARKANGTYKADNPNTTTNEAWEAIPVEDALVSKNKNKYEIRPKVEGISSNTAGKYSKKSKVTMPGMGKTTTTFN